MPLEFVREADRCGLRTPRSVRVRGDSSHPKLGPTPQRQRRVRHGAFLGDALARTTPYHIDRKVEAVRVRYVEDWTVRNRPFAPELDPDVKRSEPRSGLTTYSDRSAQAFRVACGLKSRNATRSVMLQRPFIKQHQQVSTQCVPVHGLPVNQTTLRVPLMVTKEPCFPFSTRKSSI